MTPCTISLINVFVVQNDVEMDFRRDSSESVRSTELKFEFENPNSNHVHDVCLCECFNHAVSNLSDKMNQFGFDLMNACILDFRMNIESHFDAVIAKFSRIIQLDTNNNLTNRFRFFRLY